MLRFLPLMNWQWEMFLEFVESMFHGCGFVYSPCLLYTVWLSFRIQGNDIWFVGSKGLFSIESAIDNLLHSPLTHATPSVPHPRSLISFLNPLFQKREKMGLLRPGSWSWLRHFPPCLKGLCFLLTCGDRETNMSTQGLDPSPPSMITFPDTLAWFIYFYYVCFVVVWHRVLFLPICGSQTGLSNYLHYFIWHSWQLRLNKLAKQEF